MITEKHFVHSYSSFWKDLLPMENEYIRLINSSAELVFDELVCRTDPAHRGLINELASLIYAESVFRDMQVLDVSLLNVDELERRAIQHVKQMRQFNRTGPGRLDAEERQEACDLAVRISTCVRYIGPKRIRVIVPLPGCGRVDGCSADMVLDDALVEMKCGQRHFRSVDMRQLLVYAALNYASKSMDIDKLILVNPRCGTLHREPVEIVCRRLSGSSAADVLGQIVDCMSAHRDLGWDLDLG